MSFLNQKVIDAYAKTQSADAAINAERIFQRMEEVYANGNFEAKPNVNSFNTGTLIDGPIFP